MNIKKYMEQFLSQTDRRAIYNEFSFQHEFGVYLRNNIEKDGYKVEFERNVKDLGIKSKTVKKEVDIVVYKNINDNRNKYAIELKYHPAKKLDIKRKCNAPQRMFDSIIDIKFMEQLNKEGFTTYTFVIAEDHRFYDCELRKKASNNIYDYFRYKKVIHGTIENGIHYANKQRGTDPVDISGKYEIEWKDLVPSSNENKALIRKYYILEMKIRNQNK